MDRTVGPLGVRTFSVTDLREDVLLLTSVPNIS